MYGYTALGIAGLAAESTAFMDIEQWIFHNILHLFICGVFFKAAVDKIPLLKVTVAQNVYTM